jgi:adenosylcobyric acid synthase
MEWASDQYSFSYTEWNPLVCVLSLSLYATVLLKKLTVFAYSIYLIFSLSIPGTTMEIEPWVLLGVSDCEWHPCRMMGRPAEPVPAPDPSRAEAASAAADADADGGGVPTLAVLGTMSDAGKSTIAAGICRVVSNAGFRPAPFKAQNMSNNAHPAWIPPPSEAASFPSNEKKEMETTSTSSYGEIGVAQAVQARACRLPPTVHMNPVLLKSGGTRPIRRRRGCSSEGDNDNNNSSSSSCTGADVVEEVEYLCSVVVLGRTVAVETFGDLGQRRDTLLELVLRAHDDLIQHTNADVVVMEGAGSCTELNLMSRDIVNLPLVRALRQRRQNGKGSVGGCNWLLVANIDCGGVFAQVVGTKACLPAEDWDSCAGIVINKLRGEAKYFEPGPKMIEVRIGSHSAVHFR